MSAGAIAISQKLQEIAALIDQELQLAAGSEERIAFTLFVWTEGAVSYVANTTDKKEMIAALEKMIAKWKAGMPDIPLHERN
jgi:hypothetical protein